MNNFSPWYTSLFAISILLIPGTQIARAQELPATILRPAPETHYLFQGEKLRECFLKNEQVASNNTPFSCEDNGGEVLLDFIAPAGKEVSMNILGITEGDIPKTLIEKKYIAPREEHMRITLFENGSVTQEGQDLLSNKNGLMGQDYLRYQLSARYPIDSVPRENESLRIMSDKQSPYFFVEYGWAILNRIEMGDLCRGESVTYNVRGLPGHTVLMILEDESRGEIIRDETIVLDKQGRATYTLGEFAPGVYRLRGYFGRMGQKIGVADLEQAFEDKTSMVFWNRGQQLDLSSCGNPIADIPKDNVNKNEALTPPQSNNDPRINRNTNQTRPSPPVQQNSNLNQRQPENTMCQSGQALQGTCNPAYRGIYTHFCGDRRSLSGVQGQSGEFDDSFYAVMSNGACSTEPTTRSTVPKKGRSLSVVVVPTDSIRSDIERKKTAIRSKIIQYWCQKNSDESIQSVVGALDWLFARCEDGFEAGKNYNDSNTGENQEKLSLRFDEIKAQKVCTKHLPDDFGIRYPTIAYIVDTLPLLLDATRLYEETYAQNRASFCNDFSNTTPVSVEDLFAAPGVVQLANTYAAQSTHQCVLDCTGEHVELTFMTPQSPLIYLYSRQASLYTVFLENMAGQIRFTSPAAYSAETNERIRWDITADASGRISVPFVPDIFQNIRHLFYEFTLDTGKDFTRPRNGYVIEYEGLNTFLRNDLLERLGLSEQQKDDYIRDMLPRLRKSNYYFIGILNSGIWNDTVRLSVTPPVETTERIMLYFEALDEKTASIPPEIAPFHFNTRRSESALLELGGYVKRTP